MAETKKPFDLAVAEEVRMEGSGPFILPLCMPDPELAIGETMAILVLETVDEKQVGIPIGHQTLSDLYHLIGRALLTIGPDEGETVQ